MLEEFGISEKDISATTETLMTYMTTYGIEVLGAIIVLIAGWWFAGWAKKITEKALNRVKNADPTLTGFLSSVVRYLILAVTVVAVLGRFGVETTSLIAVMGAAGLAIGLALQGTLSNVAAGVMLLFFRPFRVGQFVDTGGHMGTVQHLGLFVTELSTIDNVQIIIPNSDIWGAPIKNFSVNGKRRLDLQCGIGYGDNIDDAIAVFRKVVESDERVLTEPAELTVFVDSLGDSSVNITARFWLKSSDYWQTKWDLTRELKMALDKADIEIPFPQRFVHMVQPPVVEEKPKTKKTKKAA